MIPELIFNLFVYSTLDFISEVGVVTHTIIGDDNEKLDFLKNAVDEDFKRAIRFELPDSFKLKQNNFIRNGIDYVSYRDLCNQGHSLLIFENVFQYYRAGSNPLVVTTPVKDGKIHFSGIAPFKNAEKQPPSFMHIDKPDEWYINYVSENVFHFDRLINDDFLDAIRYLFKGAFYVSAIKLLMICIDSVSYLEYGDINNSFKIWLDQYTELDKLQITSEELWEFRNSLLHMTNLDSKKVKLNKVKRLMFYVANQQTSFVQESDEGKYFNFKDLIDQIALGIAKWSNTYNVDRSKFEDFVNRYDRIISDKRQVKIFYTDEFNKKDP